MRVLLLEGSPYGGGVDLREISPFRLEGFCSDVVDGSQLHSVAAAINQVSVGCSLYRFLHEE